MTLPEHFSLGNRKAAPKPYHYRECGLPNIYLVNGFELVEHDGDQYVSVENIDGLWKAIGLKLVLHRKVLSPREIRYLRHHIDMTQSELASMLRVGDQTVARWEKGKAKMPGPADLSLRALFLASDIAQPEGSKILTKWLEVVTDLVEQDQPGKEDLLFILDKKGWDSDPRKVA